MSQVAVRVQLESRLKAINEIFNPLKPYPISYQNVPFTKPASGIWLECFVIPNDSNLRDVSGAGKTFLGLFQVNVWTPVGAGMREVEQVVDRIQQTAFPVVPKIGAVSVEKTTAGPPISDDSGWIAVPVLINYRYET